MLKYKCLNNIFFATLSIVLICKIMSFFVRPNQKKQRFNHNHIKTNRKRKFESNSQQDEEITSSSEDEGIDERFSSQTDSEDENETAQEKKLRLAKVYLKEIEREEQKRLLNGEVDKNVIEQRLKEDYLKQTGKFKFLIADKYIKADVDNIKVLKCREQRNTITCFCLTSDDKYIFSGSKDGVIIKYSMEEGRKLKTIPFVKNNVDRILGHSSSIFSIAVCADQSFLVVGDNSGHIQVWNPNTLEHLSTLKGHRSAVTGLCFKKNDHILYSCSKDRSVRIWSLDEMAFVENLFGHQDTITAIDVMNSDRPVTAGGKDGTLRLWKVDEESQLIFNAYPSNVDCVKLITEQNFVSGSDDGLLAVWSLLKKKPLCSIKAAHGLDSSNSQPNWITSVTSLSNSDLIASGSNDGMVRLWKLDNGYRTIEKLFEIPISGYVNCLQFSNDGKCLIVGCGKDHRFGRWSTIKSAMNCIRVVPLVKMNRQIDSN